MGAQRVKLSTEMQYLQEALKSGRATLQKFSMKPLAKLDKAMQPRVIHLNMDHVKNLGDILQIQLKLGRDLDPGVLFHDPTTGWLGLVDGWHRLRAYQVAKLDYFPAYVIEGTREEALEYAAMANQHAMLRRTPEDIEKQLDMLFAIPSWWASSDSRVGGHVGVGGGVVRRRRIAYSEANALEISEEIIDIRGRPMRRLKVKRDAKVVTPPRIYKGANGKYIATLQGKNLYLGGDREIAEKTLADKVASAQESLQTRRHSLQAASVRIFFLSRNLLFCEISVGSNQQGVTGLSGHGCTIIRSYLSRQDDSAVRSFGPVLALREFDNPAHRAVVVCYPEDGPEEILDLGRRLGIEFLTPEQLVASIKGDDPDDTQASPAPPAPDKPDGDREPTTDAVEILHRRYFEGKPEMMAMLAEERANAEPDDELDSVKVQTVEQFLAEFHAKGDDTQAEPAPAGADADADADEPGDRP